MNKSNLYMMKEISQGTMFGFEVVIKVPDDFPADDKIINKNTLENYVKQQQQRAKEELEEDNLLKL